METSIRKNTNQGKKLIILGFVTIVILFLMYSRYQDPELLTPNADRFGIYVKCWLIYAEVPPFACVASLFQLSHLRRLGIPIMGIPCISHLGVPKTGTPSYFY